MFRGFIQRIRFTIDLFRFRKNHAVEISERFDKIVEELIRLLGQITNAPIMDEMKFLPSYIIEPQIKSAWDNEIRLLISKNQSKQRYRFSESDIQDIINGLTSESMYQISEMVAQDGRWKVRPAAGHIPPYK